VIFSIAIIDFHQFSLIANSFLYYSLLSNQQSFSYENTGLESGTAYYYKVRAYTTMNNSNVYSSYSPVVSAAAGYIPVTEVSLDKNFDTLTLGEEDPLTAAVLPADATNQAVTWQSSDTGVVTVDDTGIITTIGAGTADITVTTADGSTSDTCSVTVNNAEIKGIDVSKWQGTINWASVKDAGIQFAMLRSSYGSSSVDSTFETYYQQAKANGIAVGAYHYSYATTIAKATTEVNFLISKLNGKQFEYPICVDIEDTSQSSLDQETLTEIALTYLEKLRDAGYYPIIYANKKWFLYRLDDSKLTYYNHWVAQWGSSITYTGNVGMWQYSSTGVISGISGNVDLDISFIDYEARIKSLHLNGY
jgi:GH25 family lysozyme M1 (1,4-beta-N-acetylmuramidase)